MTDRTRKTCGKIQSARHWLMRAEQDISRDATVRGQMGLLLAEAELKSVKENLQSHPKTKIFSLLQHTAAFGVAAVLCVSAIGGAWWWTQAVTDTSANSSVASPTGIIEFVSSNQAIPAQAVSAQAPAAQSVAPVSVVKPAEPRQEVHGSTAPVNKESAVSPDEMQRLIRAAGQSLRGQTKP